IRIMSYEIDDPHFLERVSLSLDKEQENPLSFLWDLYEPLSSEMDKSGLQDSSAMRTKERALRIARYLIDDEGVMDLALLSPLIEAMKQHLAIIGPGRAFDMIKWSHQINVLEKLYEDKELRRLLFSIDKPDRQ